MDILVDSNVILGYCYGRQKMVFSGLRIRWLGMRSNPYPGHQSEKIIYAEVSSVSIVIEELRWFAFSFFRRDRFHGKQHSLRANVSLAYRKKGGRRTSPLPDFFIGAHAAIARIPLLTRDVSRYRTSFPNLKLIAPVSRKIPPPSTSSPLEGED